MKTKLQLSQTLELPIDVITQKLAFLGITGSGKTYAAGKLAELLLSIGAQVVVLDPVGTFWGLRLAANGKDAGFNIPIFGGLKGDIPLEPTAGALIADIIVDRGISAVLDVSHFATSEHYKFALAFATRLFERRKAQPAAMHLIIEEAQEFVPQNATDKGDEPKMLRAFERLWKIGRNFGIGGSLLTQRPQEVNKKVLNMSSAVFAFNMIGKQEREAVRDWLRSNMSGAEAIVDTLPQLEIGHAHVFSPRFLKINQVVRIAPKITYNASETPSFSALKQEAARPLSPIDLKEIKAALVSTIERAESEDPRRLKQRIRELERQLETAQQTAAPKIERVPVIESSDVQELLDILHKFQHTAASLTAKLAGLPQEDVQITMDTKTILCEVKEDILRNKQARAFTSKSRTGKAAKSQLGTPKKSIIAIAAVTGLHEPKKLPKAQQTILDALAWLTSCGIVKPTRQNVAVIAGMSKKGGYFRNTLGNLSTAQLIEYPAADLVTLTQTGSQQASLVSAPRDLGELHARWFARLPKAQRALLSVLIKFYPQEMSRADLAERAELDDTGGYFRNAIGALSSLGLVEYPTTGFVRASDLLFPGVE